MRLSCDVSHIESSHRQLVSTLADFTSVDSARKQIFRVEIYPAVVASEILPVQRGLSEDKTSICSPLVDWNTGIPANALFPELSGMLETLECLF